MELSLTEEQKNIIATNENIVIKASAGTGKTHTLVEYIKTRPVKCSVLYLAFNKSVKEEAERKFKDIDHCYVDVRTAHSLAYGAIVVPNKYQVGFINCEDIMKLYKVRDYVLATHIIKLITLYSNSKEENIEDVNYLASLQNKEAIEFAEAHYNTILAFAIDGVDAMKKGLLPMIHDFYLKLYQLSKPTLKFDYILFDEGQDASETMLDIFLSQDKAIKIIVGDNHQQIYSWRGAVNSLEKVKYKSFELSESFRFNQDIADMAVKAIMWKNMIYGRNENGFKITGSGTPNNNEKKTKAILARTNIKLIDYVIKNVILENTYKTVYFEGGFQGYSINNVYMYVHDILALKNEQSSKVKNKRLAHIKNMAELKEFISQTEDGTLAQAVQMVESYGKNLPEYIEKIKLAESKYKDEADIIVSTIFKSKGMEYDDVELLDDFNDKDDLEEILTKRNSKFIENPTKENTHKWIITTWDDFREKFPLKWASGQILSVCVNKKWIGRTFADLKKYYYKRIDKNNKLYA